VKQLKRLLSFVAAVALLLGLSTGARAQTEVSILMPNPVRGALDKLIPQFESQSGYKVKLTHGRGLGTRDQVAHGEMFDVSILLPPYPEALASGNIDPKSATTLASLTLSLGVKKGALKPDISSPEALKKVLLEANSIAYVDPNVGSDGFSTRDALQKLGVLDAIASKTKLGANANAAAAIVAKGDADVCIFYFNEMLPNTSVDTVGRLPGQFANPGQVVAFISTHTQDAKAAKALLDYLSSPDAEASYKADGLIPGR
jgi:molybdate transport system substrate-binding protein